MFPTFLITFREVVEASVIVSLILGILKKSNQSKSIQTVWIAILLSFVTSIILLLLASVLGLELHRFYLQNEAYIEGFLMLFSAIFITWTIFFLHNYFSISQRQLTAKITKTIGKQEQRGVFILVFSSVFREGFEIIIFLSTIILTSPPKNILIGFVVGVISGIATSIILYRLTKKINLYKAVSYVNIFLVIFSGGLIIRGIREFTEIGLIPEIGNMVFKFIPLETTFIGGFSKSMLGITQEIDIVQLLFYAIYLFIIMKFILATKRNYN